VASTASRDSLHLILREFQDSISTADHRPSASSHSHSFSHTRGGGGSISQTSDGSHSALQPKSQARNDEASSRELGRRTSLSR